MTDDRKEKLKDLLYNKKMIADYKEEDPLVAIYFYDLVDLMDNYCYI